MRYAPAMPEKTSSPLTSRSIFGLIIVTIGVLLTLDNLGLVEIGDLWQYWPAILVLIGVAKLSAGTTAGRGGGLFWLAAGLLLLVPVVFEEVEWEDIWRFWPVVLIVLGISMVARSFSDRRPLVPVAVVVVAPPPAAGEVRAIACLSTVRRTIEEPEFRGGDLTAVLGSCQIDLTRAGLAAEGAVIEIFAFWGGIELRIPEDWALDLQASVLMGGIEDKTQSQDSSAPRLVVKGLALMGGLEVRN